ncbi:MAG: hypothetical protein P1U65_13430 [Minwuia sp.]|nr:hypothetical protein [Minwuia sp.]
MLNEANDAGGGDDGDDGGGGDGGGDDAVVDDDDDDGDNDDDVVVEDGNDNNVGSDGGDDVQLGGGNDSFNGGAGNDTINGGAGNDVLVGGAGDDVVNGDADNDTLTGVDGNDLLNGGPDIDTVSFAVSSNGVDANLLTGTARSIGQDEIGQDTLIGIENIIGSSGSDLLTGDTLDNRLDGGAGDDTLAGISGNDTLIGGGGTDTADFSAQAAAVTVNLLTGTATGETSGTDSLNGVENVIGGSAADQITGDSLGNALDGGAGNDSLFGGAGTDSLTGGSGNDSLDGGAGIDFINAGDGDDTVIGGADGDDLSGAAGNDSLAGGAGNDTLDGGTGDDTLDGGIDADRINGGAGVDNLLGASGDDLIAGGGADDTLDGGDGSDFLIGDTDLAGQTVSGDAHTPVTVTVEVANDGGVGSVQYIFFTLDVETAITITTDGPTIDPEMFLFNDDGSLDAADFLASDDDDGLPAGSFSNAIINTGDEIGNLPAGDYVLAISDFNLSLEEAVAGINDEGGALLLGDVGVTFEITAGTILVSTAGVASAGVDPGNDVLLGGAGNDTLQGEAGDDSLDGGAGNDVLTGGAGDDTLNGGDGVDIAVFSDVAAGLDVDVDEGTVSGEGLDEIANIETFLLGTGDDTVAGGAVSEQFFGGQGNDSINAGAGDDQVVGDIGADTLFGADGADALFGGADDDFFDGGAGNDTLSGGDGTDTALFTYGGQAGVVVNLTEGTATDEFGDADQLEGIENVVGSSFDDNLTGDGANNLLDGGDGNDTLLGAAGQDTLLGANGNDFLNLLGSGSTNASGGAGNDIFAVDATVLTETDVVDGGDGTDTLAISGGGTLDQGDFSGVSNVETFLPTTDAAIDLTIGDNVVAAGGTLFVDGQLLVGSTSTMVFNGSSELDGNISVQGGNAADELDGGQADDTLRGGDGTDTLQGNDGSDVLDGGDSFDTASFADLDRGIDANLATGLASDGQEGGDIDTLIAVEGLLGSDFDDTLTAGEAEAHDLVGGAGDDQLIGGSGIMFIDGGVGDDTVTMAIADLQADDSVSGGADSDTLRLIGGGETDDAQLDGVSKIEAIELVTDAETDLSLRNGQVNTSGTIAINAAALAAATSSLLIDAALKSDASITVNSGAANDVIFATQGDDSVAGNAGQDAVFGGAGDDTLSGGAGVDLLQGDAGGDQIFGGAGQDLISGGAGDDLIDGGAGIDIADFAEGGTAVVVDLGVGVAAGAASGNDTLTDIEVVLGSAAADTIQLADGVDGQAAVGGAGNDTLTGGDLADDALLGQLGNDQAFGGSGDDFVDGGGGDDTLSGGDGVDELEGGAGNDLITGGAGDDSLIGDQAADGDQALSFDGVDDSIAVTGFSGLAGTADATFEAWLEPGAARDMVVFDARETIDGNETGMMLGFRDAGEGELVAVARIAGNGQSFEVTSGVLQGRDGMEHFAVTFDRDGLMTLFFNGAVSGQAVNIAALNGVDISTQSPLLLGESNIDDEFSRYVGTMDEARVWSVVRSQSEIADARDDLLVGDEAGLALYLDFDEEGLQAALDQTAAGSTAIFFGDIARVQSDAGIVDVTSGDDTLDGGDGVDELIGGDGDDVILSGAGLDQISGDDGTDTLDFVNAIQGVSFDLLTGDLSDDGFGNSETAGSIENASGSAFADTFSLGLDAVVSGEDGDDLFVTQVGIGSATISDFDAGAETDDVLDVSAFGFGDLAAVLEVATDDGVDTTIQLSAAESIVLSGVEVSDLAEDDFIFDENAGQGDALVDLAGITSAEGFVFANDINRQDFGSAISGAGDVNGDGIDDLLIGSYRGNGTGEAFVLFGDPALDFVQIEDGTLAANSRGIDIQAGNVNENADFGQVVQAIGDINGDGFTDFAVSAPALFNDFYAGYGGVAVIFGDANGLTQNIDVDNLDGSNGFAINPSSYDFGFDSLGRSIAGAGDFNGDGIDDLAFSAVADGEGKVVVLFGSANGFPADVETDAIAGQEGGDLGLVITGGATGTQFGADIDFVGDFDGDGLDDLVIGEPLAAQGGNAFVVFGSENLSGNVQLGNLTAGDAGAITISSGYAGDRVGGAVSRAGDINNDGFDDVVVGAVGADYGSTEIGAAHVIFGSGAAQSVDASQLAIDGISGFTIFGNQIDSNLGTDVAGGGDLNGDGIADIVIGVSGASYEGTAHGEVLVVFGSDDGFEKQITVGDLGGDNGVVVRGDTSLNTSIGNTVAIVGDVNGDGFDDLAFSVEDGLFYNGGPVNTDSVLVLYGSDNTGLAQVGGSGADELSGDANDNLIAGAQGDDTLNGLDGQDVLRGALGDDSLDGGAGADLLVGGAGTDVLIGGGGNDTLLPGTNDGSVGDFIQGGIDSNLIVFDAPGSGFFIVDYSDQTAAITANIGPVDGTVTKIGGVDTLEGVNLIDGNVGGLQLNGGAGADVITASLQSGDEFIQVRGGAGNDTITGGDGFDRLDYVGATTGVHIDVGLGQTLIDGFGGIDSFSQIDEFRGSDNADTLIGSDGNDRFITRQGDDTVDGAGGFDLLRYDRANIEFVNVDLSINSADVQFIGVNGVSIDTITNIESVRGSRTGNDTLTGDAQDNQLDGRGGNDLIDGGDGNDTLLGGDGDDTLLSGTNDGSIGDVLNTGDGNDTILFVDPGDGFFILDYTAQSGGIVANIGNTDGTISKLESDEIDTLQGVDLVDGSVGGLRLKAGSGDDIITVDLLSGDEFIQIRAGAGNDTITGGGGFDRLDYTDATAGVNVNISLGLTTNDGQGGVDTFSQIDEFQGSSFIDTLLGSDGNDRFITGRGNDAVDGGLGFDLVRYDRSNIEFVDVDLSAGTASVQFTGDQFLTVDSLISIESVRGSREGDDTLFGDDADNQLDGRGGDDILKGGAGNDTLIGRDGVDSFDGGDGIDAYLAFDGEQGVVVDLSTGIVTNDGFGNAETLISIEQVAGSNFDDELTFGISTSFSGNSGDDLFIAIEGIGSSNFVFDFVAGAGTDDALDVSAFGIQNLTGLLELASDDGTNTTIQLGEVDAVTLIDVLVGDLAADDFVFADAQPIDPLLDLGNDFDATIGFIFGSAESGEKFGFGIDGIGDINGDGLDDIIVGAGYGTTYYGEGQSQTTGEAFVLFGNTTPGFTQNTDNLDTVGLGFEPFQSDISPFGIFGYDVAGIGDLNGDGFNDFAISARNEYTRNVYGTGEVTVVFGTEDGLGADLDVSNLDGSDGFTILANSAGIGELGYSIAGGGDFNGDGIDDLIIGAASSTYGQANAAGEVFVVFGSTDPFVAGTDAGTLLATGRAAVIQGQDQFARFGESVDFAGDFNGDGFDDIIVGAPDADGSGEAFVIFGTGDIAQSTLVDDLVTANEAIVITGSQASDALGHAVSGAGDVNGDGLDDVIIGSPYNDDVANDAGAAFVIFGTSTPGNIDTSLIALDGNDGFAIFGRSEADSVGFAVDGGGDANGDGFGDLLVGAFNADYSGNYGLGEVYVVFGTDGGFASQISPDDFDGLNGLVIRGADTGTYTGREVAFLGDVNGDGFDDVALSSYYTASGGGLYDAAFIVFGVDNTGQAQVGDANANLLTGDGDANLLVGGAGDDTLDGLGGNDTLIGATGDDSLIGGDDNDLLRGGSGSDVLEGGAGDDTILPGSNDGSGEVIITGTGNDTVNFDNPGSGFFVLDYSAEVVGVAGSITDADGTVVKASGTDTLQNVDLIDGNVGGLQITGSQGDDIFAVDLVDTNEFIQFRGGAGNDDFTGGDGFDRLDYVGAAGGVNLNIALGQTSDDGDGGVDTFSNVDEFRGSDNDDIMIGSAGDDRFITRFGNDIVDGVGGFDLVRYDRATVEFVDVDLTAETANVRQGGFDFVDQLFNVEAIRGSRDGDDTISGSAASELFEGRGGADLLSGLGGADTLKGQDGDDTIDGGEGIDVLEGGNGTDLLIADFSGDANSVIVQGTDEDITQATSLFQVGGSKTISGFEQASLTGGNAGDELVGGALDDTLTGNGGNDTLHGGSGGVDIISGGAGNDTLTGTVGSDLDGGDGIDQLDIDLSSIGETIIIDDLGGQAVLGDGTSITSIEALNAVLGSGDDIIDFSNTDKTDVIDGGDGDDTIDAGRGNDTLAGGNGIDLLIADFSGSVNSVITQGTDDDITQATIINQIGDSKTIDGFERVDLTGSSSNDELVGGAFDDTLVGNEGGDTLHGGSGGSDRISGGAGDDIMTGSATGTFDGGAGIDLLGGDFSSITEDMIIAADDGTDVFADGTSITSIEALKATLGSGNDSVDFAGIDKSDVIDGGDGNDTIDAGTNNDTLSGGNGIDLLIADFSGSVNSVITQGTDDDITQATIINQIGDSKTIDGFEIASLTGSSSNDELVGGAFDDTLIGNGGGDTLHGGSGGSDLISGGIGDDFMTGSASGEFDGGAGIDLLAGDFSSITEDMNIAADDGTDVFADGTSITSIEALNATLGSGNDTVDFAAIDKSDVIDGGDGNDTINAGTNNDTLFGGNGIDLLIADFSGSVNSVITQGTDDDITQATILNQIGDSKTISGFEFVSLTGSSSNDELVGGNLNDTLIGGGGNDTLNGGSGGADDLFGGDGNDTIVGGGGGGTIDLGAGDDSVQGDAGDDTIDGGDGFDAIAYDNEAGGLGVTVDLSTGTATDTFGDQDQLTSIERVVGSAQNDDIFGSNANEQLQGDGGDDLLEGGGGVDTLVGGAGSDEFLHSSLGDITTIATNITVAASGQAVDLIDDFVSGTDQISFDLDGGFEGIGIGGFIEISEAYDGTNSGGQGFVAYIFDGTHLIYDDDLQSEGYQVVADMNGASVVAGDLAFIGGGGQVEN